MLSRFGRSVGVHNTEYEVADRGSTTMFRAASPQRNGDSVNIGSARSLEVGIIILRVAVVVLAVVVVVVVA